ncbi:hypothetical protein BGX27_006535 [Mortierella sp. AM989]|nr:hypothetical protein BGX27_006535 [Mortierella sp. AM989]
MEADNDLTRPMPGSPSMIDTTITTNSLLDDQQYNESFDDIFEPTSPGGTTEKEVLSTSTPSISRNQSQVFMPSLPPTSSLRTSSTISDLSDITSDADTSVELFPSQQSDGPKPLAVKPAYKKRIVIPASGSDGIIRKSGALAAMEKQLWEMQPSERKAQPISSIYDKPTSNLQHTRPLLPTQLKRRQSKPKPPKPPRKIKPRRPPTLWKPSTDVIRKVKKNPSSRAGNRRSKANGLVQPVNIEALVKQQEFYQKRISQLVKTPLPFRDLQTLVKTELEKEELALRELGILLHKEYLKLQLEEGVLTNMLRISQSGTLDVTDLELVRPRTKWTKRELRDMAREKARAERNATRKGINKDLGSNPDIPIDVDGGTAHGHYDNAALDREESEDDGEDDQEDDDDDGEEGEEEEGEEVEREGEEEVYDSDDDEDYDGDLDTELSRPIYSLPGESYSSRPLASTIGSLEASTVGRPGASISQSYDSLSAIKKLVTQNGKKRKLDNTEADADAENDDIYELEYDDEVRLYISEDEDNAYSGSENEYDYEDDQQDEDDQKAREALQRMLNQYGGGT